jgi:pyruvate dehydrogenase E2 component (dihydrolipoamide acetyltransferase)
MRSAFSPWKSKGGELMAKIVVMPKLGLTMKEGTVARWYKNEGDEVGEKEVLFDVETDKLTNEVEAPEGGVVRKILVPEGETVECLKPLAIIASKDEDISSLLKEAGAPEEAAEASKAQPETVPEAAARAEQSAEAGRIVAAPAAKKLAAEKGIDLGMVKGTGPGGRIVIKDVEDFQTAAAAASASAPQKVSPVAAKMAEELKVDVTGIRKEGRIMKEDVLAAAAAEVAAAAAVSPEGKEKRVRMTQMRRIIAARMQESWDVSPAVSYDIRVDVSRLMSIRESLKDKAKVTYTDLLVKIAAAALLEHPLLNSSIDGDEIIMKEYVNIGVAVAVEGGLLVPVVRGVQDKGLKEISETLSTLAQKAREGELSSDDLQGGTFTITNLGMFGIESFSPIINQPQVAILGVNAIVETPVVVGGEISVRPLMNLSLTADHRVVDGAVAAQFLKKVKELVENPELLLL